jgi:hypothetical protein
MAKFLDVGSWIGGGTSGGKKTPNGNPQPGGGGGGRSPAPSPQFDRDPRSARPGYGDRERERDRDRDRDRDREWERSSLPPSSSSVSSDSYAGSRSGVTSSDPSTIRKTPSNPTISTPSSRPSQPTGGANSSYYRFEEEEITEIPIKPLSADRSSSIDPPNARPTRGGYAPDVSTSSTVTGRTSEPPQSSFEDRGSKQMADHLLKSLERGGDQMGDDMIYMSQVIQQKDLYKKRVAELEEELQTARLERATCIEQLNKQFKEEEKLMADMASLKSEFEDLRKNYLATLQKLNDWKDPAIAEALREENSILKEKLALLEVQSGGRVSVDSTDLLPSEREALGASSNPGIAALELKLKRAMEEKAILLNELNNSMNTVSWLERENKQLREIEDKLRYGADEKATPEAIIRQLELHGSSILMYNCTRLQDKIALIDAAVATRNPNVITTVILYLRDTLSQPLLFEILGEPKRGQALAQYRQLLVSCGYESELGQLYRHLHWDTHEGMFILRQAFRIKNPTERMNALLLCVNFMNTHEGLQWYGEQLQNKVNSLNYLLQQQDAQSRLRE